MSYNPPAVDIVATGTIAANTTSTAVVALNGNPTYAFTLSGTWVGTVQVQMSVDGTTYVNLTANTAIWRLDTNATVGGSITANGTYRLDVGGAAFARIITTAFTSGTINVSARASIAPSVMSIDNGYVNATQSGNWLTKSATARVTLQASAAQTASNNSATSTGNSSYITAQFFLNCTAASGTTPTLNVRMQCSDDGGTTWYDLVYPGTTNSVAFTQLTATGSQSLNFIGCIGDTLRVASIITGTTPSFTYAVKAVYVS